MTQAYIIAHNDLRTLDILQVLDYSVEMDAEYNGRSHFTANRKPEYERGDYVFLKDDSGLFFTGLIDNVENIDGQNAHNISMMEIENIFDRKIILSDEELISSTGIEDFIVNIINQQFIASDDQLLNMTYITAKAATHSKVRAKVETDEGGIYNFKTYLGNAREHYGIFLQFSFKGKTMEITVSKREQELFKFDSTVSDVKNYEEVYSVDALTKLTAVWKIPDRTEDDQIIIGETTILKYYLRSDRTLTTDVNDPDRAAGTEDTIYIQSDEREDVIEQIQNQFKANAYEHSVTASIRRNSQIYPARFFYVGHKCSIKTRSRGVKDSIINRITFTSDSAYINVKFGNMAITLIEKIKGGIRK